MQKTIDGLTYVKFLENGINNVVKNKKELNDLNVFPVPDGDTGTNMSMTLRQGLQATDTSLTSLAEVANQFASSAVFGARGNSGVIVSQFFKGIAKGFGAKSAVDVNDFIKALERGSKSAYSSVVKPVEGTMLTVVREAVEEVKRHSPEFIEEVIDLYLVGARQALDKTPSLLPVLKKAGVVDSGGMGIVCFFEGIQKFLRGEEISVEEEVAVTESIDLTKFNKDTRFVYGYCTEGLLQLKMDVEDFDRDKLKSELSRIGNSIVMTVEGDKVKLHVHSKTPGTVLNCCQQYGEFLTVKIENMTLQNIALNKEEDKKILYKEEDTEFDFAVVAVAPNGYLQKKLFEMGADIVIMSGISPSAQDFLDAFSYTKAKEILVFPNSSNSILTCMQASCLYKKARVTVLNSRSVEECYVSLGLIDFEDSIENAVDVVNEAIANLYRVGIYHSAKDLKYGRYSVKKNDFFALANKRILSVGKSVEEVTISTVSRILDAKDFCVLTIFYGSEMAEEFIEMLSEKIKERCDGIEITLVAKQLADDMVLVFE
ncbi:MAG: DAK2 domain-containing protein [Clostridia bacterium]|nr:DAK2 domain-containing protein [Clostridia bacterium]